MIGRLLALLALALLFTVVGGFFGSLHPAFDSVAAFRHLVAGLALGLAILSALAGFGRAAGIALVAALAGGAGLAPDLAPRRSEAPADLRFVTANLLKDNADPARAGKVLAALGADALALQEVSRPNLAALDALGPDYPARIHCRFHTGIGVAVASRLPPVPGGAGCGEALGLAWLRVAGPGGPVTLASVHLHWPYPFDQAAQVAALVPALAALPRPVLIGGDFNAAPWSHAVAALSEATGTRRVPGLRISIHVGALRIGLPIDHVLADPLLRPLRAGLGPDIGSDHLPVVAEFAWMR